MRESVTYRLGQHSGDWFLSTPLEPQIQTPRLNEADPNRPYPQYDQLRNVIYEQPGDGGPFKLHMSGFRHAKITVSFDADADFKVRAAWASVENGFRGESTFDFSEARGLNNRWDYVNLVNTNDLAAYDEGGIYLTWWAGVVNLEVNTDGTDWLGIEIFDYVDGVADFQVTMYND
jgi:hypothetical protein